MTRKHATLVLCARVVLFLGLGIFYYLGATEHAREVNNFKARGDQTQYLGDAEQFEAAAHGRAPLPLIGRRMRMPVYTAFLSLFYRPTMSDPEFFEVAKRCNIWLSLALLAVLAVIFAFHLPPLLSTNLTLVVAFGYFVFKAGYAQPELLFYFLFFLVFLCCFHLFGVRRAGRSVLLGVLGGSLAGLAYLTKAVVPPFIALFLAVFGIQELARFLRRHLPGPDAPRAALRTLVWRGASGALLAVTFLAVVYPYISNSKRVFGEYFFNYNTTYYIWYDSGAVARAVMAPYIDAEGRLSMPADERPSARKYWQTHTVSQIIGRIARGLLEILDHSYRMYWYLKYAVLYAAFAVLLIVSNWRAWAALVRRHTGLLVFLVLYLLIYLPSVAFFGVTSDTGSMRFFLAHVTPFFFVLSRFFALAPFRDTAWTLAGMRFIAPQFHVLVSVTLALDLTFTLWSRLMTTYGGF